MNKTLPTLAFATACLGIIFYFAGATGLVLIPLVVTAVLALIGQLFADPDRPLASRVACIMAVLLAATPLVIPEVQKFRLSIREKQRGRETRPIYESMEAKFETLKPAVQDYFAQYGIMPEVDGTEILPFVNETGARVEAPQDKSIAAPSDPFSPIGSPMRWTNVRDEGILLVSAGQDGVPEMPLPGVAMDGPPADPLARYALLGVDPRSVSYDPTNGALSLGDVTFYHGKRDYATTFAPLFEAWDRAASLSPYKPTKLRRPTDVDHDPQSIRDSRAASKLLGEGNYLGALGLASRSVNERHPYQAQWKEEDFQANKTRSIALYNLGAYREAADAMIDYLSDRPNDAEGHYYLAAELYLGQRQETALEHVAAAALISPQDPITPEAEAAYLAMMGRKTPQFRIPAIVESQRRAAEEAARAATAP